MNAGRSQGRGPKSFGSQRLRPVCFITEAQARALPRRSCLVLSPRADARRAAPRVPWCWSFEPRSSRQARRSTTRGPAPAVGETRALLRGEGGFGVKLIGVASLRTRMPEEEPHPRPHLRPGFSATLLLCPLMDLDDLDDVVIAIWAIAAPQSSYTDLLHRPPSITDPVLEVSSAQCFNPDLDRFFIPGWIRMHPDPPPL